MEEIMEDVMEISFSHEWQDEIAGQNPAWAATMANLEIVVGGQLLTKHDATKSNAIRKGVLVPLFEVATWYMTHRRFILSEINTKHEDFNLRHDLRMGAGGFALPHIQFEAVGNNLIKVTAEAQYIPIGTSIQYIKGGVWHVPADDLIDGFNNLVSVVIERLEQSNLNNTELHQLIAEEESHTPDQLIYLDIVAAFGYWPQHLTDQDDQLLINLHKSIGVDGLVECAAIGDLTWLKTFYSSFLQLKDEHQALNGAQLGIQLHRLFDGSKYLNTNEKPYEIGFKLAKDVSNNAGLSSSDKIDGETLIKLFGKLTGQQLQVIDSQVPTNAKLTGIALNHLPILSVFTQAKRKEQQLFLLARIIGDRLLFGDTELTLVSSATHNNSFRQQINRAFAAELLVPETILKAAAEGNGNYLDENLMNEIAIERSVSVMLVLRRAEDLGLVN